MVEGGLARVRRLTGRSPPVRVGPGERASSLSPVRFEARKLTEEEGRELFARQTLFPWWDQSKLRRARVGIIGAGGFGTVAQQLARAGIGHLVLCDADTVERSNLNRQEFRWSEVGRNKAVCLAQRIRDEVGTCSLEAYPLDFQDVVKEHPEAYKGIDMAIVLVDNNATRYFAAEHFHGQRTPVIYASVSQDGVGGLVVFQRPEGRPCWACAQKVTDKGDLDRVPCPSCGEPVGPGLESCPKCSAAIPRSCRQFPSAVYLHHVFGGQAAYLALLYLMTGKVPWLMRCEWVNESAWISEPAANPTCPICSEGVSG